MIAQIVVCVLVFLTVVSVGSALRRPQVRHIAPPQLVQRTPATLEQAAVNLSKVDDYILCIREEQHTLRQQLDRADLDTPDAEDLAAFNVVPIESALRERQVKARAKRQG